MLATIIITVHLMEVEAGSGIIHQEIISGLTVEITDIMKVEGILDREGMVEDTADINIKKRLLRPLFYVCYVGFISMSLF
jgi:hypothetical protein